MKRTLLICLLACCRLLGYSQIPDAYDSAIHYRSGSLSFFVAADTLIARSVNPADSNESNPMEKWKAFMSSRVSLDVTTGDNMYAPMSAALASYSAYFTDYCPGSGYMGNWSCLGPFQNGYGSAPHLGRIVSLWVNPNDSNIILAGADGGGLWKSTNDGHSWRCLTDGGTGTASSIFGMPGVYGIAVDPLDTNVIYILLNADFQYKKSAGYTLGVAYTTDGGNTWNADTALYSTTGFGITGSIQKVAYMPGTEKLYALSEGKIMYRSNPTATWQDITPTGFSGQWAFDMDFSLLNPGTIVFTSTDNTTGYIWIYISGTGTWSSIITDLSSLGYNGVSPSHISLSSNDIAYINFAGATVPTNNILVKTPISSFSPTVLNTNFGDNIQQFVVSPANDSVLYTANYTSGGIGGVFTQSTDNGHTFYEIAGIDHSDGRCIYIWKSYEHSDSNMVYFGSDGGVSKKRMNLPTTIGITGDSLAITQFYGFGNTEADENIMIGGAQDDAGFAYIKTNTVPWINCWGGDGYTSKFMTQGIRSAYGEYNNCPGCAPHLMYEIDFSGSGITTYGIAMPPDLAISNINRPQYFDPSNTAYVGYSHIWKMPYGSSAWTHAFLADPIDGASYTFPKLACDFYIDENDNNNVYVVYRDAATDSHGNPKDPSIDTFGRLYYSITAHPLLGLPTWFNITPSIVGTNNINSIAVDPSNFGRIWVAFGNINSSYVGASPDTMKNRVWYSNDTGRTWTDVSTGLSALPVNKLLYRKGSNDEIYAGTDVGVFKWNPSTNSWQCFNNGLPTCIVMDMEFNYCAAKLRVATYGRGIWESPLPNIVPNLSDTFFTSTTWNTNQYITTGIDIKSGATLSIKHCTVYMPKYGIIHVEPGAHLICDSCVLTNACEQCMWGGIVADGSGSATAISDAADGWVTIDSNSIVEHALVGVSNKDGTGGFIQVKNSSFIDCDTSVKLTNFVHTSGSSLSVYPCYFANTEFILDENYKGDAMGLPMLQMVYLNNVAGVSFQGCDFLNRDTFATQKGVGVGISSLNAGFNVSAVCLTPTHCLICPCLGMKNSRFCGFLNGVHIGDVMGNDFTVSIDHAILDSCGVGVFTDVQNHVSCTEDTFRVGWGVPVTDVADGCMQNIGILTQNAHQFRTEANYFEGNPSGAASSVSGWINMGTAVIGSSPHYVDTQMNTVYRNTFDSLSVGVFAFDGNFWLSILCNHFSNNGTDIYVTADNPTTYVYYGGIYWDQGSFTQSAGNTFSNSVNNIINTAMTAAGTPTTISYFYDVANSAEYPSHISPSSVYVTPITSQNYCVPTFGNLGAATAVPLQPLSPVAINADNCAFKPNGSTYFVQPFAPVILDSLGFAAYRFMYSTNKQILSDYLDVLDSLIDFGNTDSLINYIDTVTNTDSLYSTLLTGSPFLSEDAISEATIYNNQLTTAQTFQVLEHNPDVLRDPVFFGTMVTSYSFSPNQYSALDTSIVDSFTLRSIINDSIHVAIMGMDNASNVIMMALEAPVDPQYPFVDIYDHGVCQDSTSMYYLLDSNANYTNIDSVDTWLQNIGRLWTYYARVGYYNQIPDARNLPQYGIADSIFQSINGILTTRPDYTTYQTMSTVWRVLYGAEQDGRNITSLNSNEIATLDTFSTRKFPKLESTCQEV